MRQTLAFEHVLTPTGLRDDLRISVDVLGNIAALEPAGGPPYDGYLALPGIANAHSHCFQRALAGQGETRGDRDDSFWTWREAMYRLAGRITPQQCNAIAAQAFADMLRGGFTSVAEFHYLHHLPDGTPGVEMAQAVIDAAERTGIRLCLLPVFYHSSGFEPGGQPAPPRPAQRRFVHASVEDFCALLERLRGQVGGIAAHSLRAVPPRLLGALVAQADATLDATLPVHIHIAEQRREVSDCEAEFGARPIQVLARNAALGPRWNLVHATHASADERALMREADVTVVLCPLTEAYLADGVFAAVDYAAAGGRFAIGSDANQRIDAIEELRLLEYGQRLVSGRRACLAGDDGLGQRLWSAAAAGGARAIAAPAGEIAVGQVADLVVLDGNAPALRGVAPARVLDALITAGDAACISAVYVGGERRVDGGELDGGHTIGAPFDAAMRALWQ